MDLVITGAFSGSIAFGSSRLRNADNNPDGYVAEISSDGSPRLTWHIEGSGVLIEPTGVQIDSRGNVTVSLVAGDNGHVVTGTWDFTLRSSRSLFAMQLAPGLAKVTWISRYTLDGGTGPGEGAFSDGSLGASGGDRLRLSGAFDQRMSFGPEFNFDAPPYPPVTAFVAAIVPRAMRVCTSSARGPDADRPRRGFVLTPS